MMLFQTLGSHLLLMFSGAGLAAGFVGCMRAAALLDSGGSHSTSGKLRFLLKTLRFLLGVTYAISLGLVWLYVLLDLRASLTELSALIVGVATTAAIYVHAARAPR